MSSQCILLVGGALTPEDVNAFPLVSAAAANWQLHVAQALAGEYDTTVEALSYLPLGTAQSAAASTQGQGVRIRRIGRRKGLLGTIQYFISGFVEVRKTEAARLVLCYNPLLWTAPFALVAARRAGAPAVLIVADFTPADGGFWRRLTSWIESFFLARFSRFLVLSAGMTSILPAGSRVRVFNGLADPGALAARPVKYDLKYPLRFVYAGSLSEEAGLGEFLAAARSFQGDGRCEFHVFGRGPQPPEAENATFRGFVEEDVLNEFLGSNCVGVNPRRPGDSQNRYNAPYKLLKYLSRGLVTITTSTAGVPQDVAAACVSMDHTETGLRDAILYVLALSTEELESISREARTLMTRTRSSAALATIIDELLSDRGVERPMMFGSRLR